MLFIEEQLGAAGDESAKEKRAEEDEAAWEDDWWGDAADAVRIPDKELRTFVTGAVPTGKFGRRAALWCAATACVEAGVTVNGVGADTSVIVCGRGVVALAEIT